MMLNLAYEIIIIWRLYSPFSLTASHGCEYSFLQQWNDWVSACDASWHGAVLPFLGSGALCHTRPTVNMSWSCSLGTLFMFTRSGMTDGTKGLYSAPARLVSSLPVLLIPVNLQWWWDWLMLTCHEQDISGTYAVMENVPYNLWLPYHSEFWHRTIFLMS